MKFKEWLSVILLMLMPMCAGAQGVSTAEQVDDEVVYQGILDSFYALIVQRNQYEELGGAIGVLEATAGMEKSEALESVGYSIADVNKDGVKELLIGRVMPKESTPAVGEIYAVYTHEKDAPMLVAEGWARSRYYQMNDGRFLYEGSASAFESAVGMYALNGKELKCEAFYFTAKASDKYSVYYNQSGEWDVTASTAVAVSEFSAKSKEWTAKTVNVDYTPFAEYSPSVIETVCAHWMEDVAPLNQAYHIFIAEQSDYSAQVLFTTDVDVTHFKVFALSFEDVSVEGQLVFKSEILCEFSKLSAQYPLMVEMSFYGSIPNAGISYVDANGIERYYSVSVSGFDGSLILSEIQLMP